MCRYALLFLLACGPVFSAPSPLVREAVQFAVWHSGDSRERRTINDVLSSAQRSRPGLSVVAEGHPGTDPYRQMQLWCKPGAAGVPDIVVLRDQWLPDFAAFLEPLNARLYATDLRSIPESVRSRLRFAGNLYGVPWQVNTLALYYRPDLLEAAGMLPPRTWEELLICARRVHNPPEVYGFGLSGNLDGGAAEALLQMLWSYGADLPALDRPSALPAEVLSRCLQLYSDLHAVAEPEVLSWNQDALEDHFLKGKLAMIVADRTFRDHLEAQTSAPKWAVTSLPAGTSPAGRLTVDMACVFKSSTHREAAAHVLRCLTTFDAITGLTKLGSVPFHTDLVRDLRLDPLQAPFSANLEQARGLPLQRWPSARDAFSEGLVYLLSGRMSVAEAADLIQKRLAEGEAPHTP